MIKNPPIRILFCSAPGNVAESIASLVGQKGFQIESYPSLDKALTELESGRFDTFLMRIDGDEGDISQIEKLSIIYKIDPDLPVVVICGIDSIEFEKSARLQNVFYYLVEPVNLSELLQVLRESARLRVKRAEKRI